MKVEERIAELEEQINQHQCEIERLQCEIISLQTEASGYKEGTFVIYYSHAESRFFGPDQKIYNIMQLLEIAERTDDGEISYRVQEYDYLSPDIEKVKSEFFKDYNAGVAKKYRRCYRETDVFIEAVPVNKVKQKDDIY